jgi:serine/threonine protein kinase
MQRDLKPDNIGFDDEGVLKLFDFGLAKELSRSSKASSSSSSSSSKQGCLYHMTGFTGAIRYMAPEVGLYQPYNLSADVYSWSMLFWYLLALQPPMGLYTPSMFLDRVFQRGHRPAMKESWPADWTNLMRACWDADLQARPSFFEIRQYLKKFIRKIDPEVSSFLHDDDSNHDHYRQPPQPQVTAKKSSSSNNRSSIPKTRIEASPAPPRDIQPSSTTPSPKASLDTGDEEEMYV